MARGKEVKGKVILDLGEELCDSELNDEQTESLAHFIKGLWEDYIHMNAQAYAQRLSPTVRCMSGRNRVLSDDREAILANLPAEWQAYERPDKIISEEMTLRNISIWADDENEPSHAIAHYWVEIEGGVRWTYDDQGLVLQTFKREGDSWSLLHQIDGWSTAYDLDEDDYGENPTFVFDYAYPVQDLQRAVAFYTPILGKPDVVTDTQAIFGLRDPAFILDSSGLGGFAKIKEGLPNGYAILYVEDLAKEIKRLKQNEVSFLDNTDQHFKKINQDSFALMEDSGGNVVVLLERNFYNKTGESNVTGFTSNSPYMQAGKTIAEAWMAKDAQQIAQMHADGVWFDVSKVLNLGLQDDAESIAECLEKHYWHNLDYSDSGIIGTWEARNFKEEAQGDYAVLSYERTLVGKGAHPFKHRSFVTHVFSSEDSVAFTFINNVTKNNGLALELDYTGHPTEDLEGSKSFYEDQMEWDEPYVDESWYGFWSNNTVYGIFEASREDDGFPQPQSTNGYASLWVTSAAETYQYLQNQGVNFPVLPSISDKKGVDAQEGYTQVVSTDSEGNLILFTEYTGKRK